ncbi:hypothetical protein RRG08_034088 [Elysia crispata]|uniref:Uncharacterized protein n=1 Tax=Elysia crispata TaxID=231223 RepID=A0AAE1D4P4_9GAST|nr:hypothetical protein RRG08_034088 [Elysia crispata]
MVRPFQQLANGIKTLQIDVSRPPPSLHTLTFEYPRARLFKLRQCLHLVLYWNNSDWSQGLPSVTGLYRGSTHVPTQKLRKRTHFVTLAIPSSSLEAFTRIK